MRGAEDAESQHTTAALSTKRTSNSFLRRPWHFLCLQRRDFAHPKTPFFSCPPSGSSSPLSAPPWPSRGSTYYFNRPAPSRIQNVPPPVAATTPAETMPRAATGSETNAPASLAPSIPTPSTSPQENLSTPGCGNPFCGGDSFDIFAHERDYLLGWREVPWRQSFASGGTTRPD